MISLEILGRHENASLCNKGRRSLAQTLRVGSLQSQRRKRAQKPGRSSLWVELKGGQGKVVKKENFFIVFVVT